jgi:cell division protein FtsB
LEEKETVIQELAVGCRERLAVIEQLTAEGEALRTREAELRKQIADLGLKL